MRIRTRVMTLALTACGCLAEPVSQYITCDGASGRRGTIARWRGLQPPPGGGGAGAGPAPHGMIVHAMDNPPTPDDAARRWTHRRADKLRRLQGVRAHLDGKRVDPAAIVAVLEALLRPGDRVALEGNNQKQADFLSRALAQVDPARVHDLHLLI